MLRFIVLGEIPGTHINLTFLQVVLILGVFYSAILWRRDHRSLRQHSAISLDDKAI